MWGLMVRDEHQCLVTVYLADLAVCSFLWRLTASRCLRRPVGFHAVAWQTGCSAPREARVVVLPEYQGQESLIRISQTLCP